MSGEERVSQLAGDRLCTRCSYNLTGQPVLREPHYDMLIVRCPECAAVASVQEYPLLGKWAARWGLLLAAAWFVVLVGMLFATAGVVTGVAFVSSESAARPFAQHIAEVQKAYMLEQQAAQPTTTPQQQQTAAIQIGGAPRSVIIDRAPGPWTPLDSDWADTQDFGAMLAGLGGWTALADVSGIRRVWTPLALGLFIGGCVWAIALAQVRRRWLLLAAALPIALAGVFALITLAGDSAPIGWGWSPVLHAARRELAPPIVMLTIAFSYLPLAAGMLAGRPIVRGLIRALLPPRLRGALAILWLVDGKEPPPSPAPPAR